MKKQTKKIAAGAAAAAAGIAATAAVRSVVKKENRMHNAWLAMEGKENVRLT